MRIKDADLFKIHGVDHLAKIFESENLAVFGAIHTGVGDIRHDKSWLHWRLFVNMSCNHGNVCKFRHRFI